MSLLEMTIWTNSKIEFKERTFGHIHLLWITSLFYTALHIKQCHCLYHLKNSLIFMDESLLKSDYSRRLFIDKLLRLLFANLLKQHKYIKNQVIFRLFLFHHLLLLLPVIIFLSFPLPPLVFCFLIEKCLDLSFNQTLLIILIITGERLCGKLSEIDEPAWLFKLTFIQIVTFIYSL